MHYNNSSIAISFALILSCASILAAGCSAPDTRVADVWRDEARGDDPIGKTLVLSLASEAEVTIPIEKEWARQLQSHGVQVETVRHLTSGDQALDEASVIKLVKDYGFDTLLVCHVIRVKQVGRDSSHYQVAVVETKLYDALTGMPFWSASSDIFLVGGGDNRMREPGKEVLSNFVEAMIREMARSGVAFEAQGNP
jgi:hypothetical protein